MIRGTTTAIGIAVTEADGTPYELAANDKLRFCVVRNINDDEPLITRELTSQDLSGGNYMLTLSPSDTEALEAGRYYYDCGLQTGNEYYMIIELSHFNILPRASKRSQ